MNHSLKPFIIVKECEVNFDLIKNFHWYKIEGTGIWPKVTF